MDQLDLFDRRRKSRSADEAKLIATLRDPARFVEAATGNPLSPWQKRFLRRALPPITVPK